MLMGFSPSPYCVTKDILVVEKMMRGDILEVKHIFRWWKVILNLPGLEKYDPRLPWVYKARADGSIAADVLWYIDDGRPTAGTTWEAWKAARKIRYTLFFLGLQDTRRKRTEASQAPGEWAGTMVESTNNQTSLLVSISKWQKGTGMLVRIQEELETRGCLNHKQLERDQGFLIYLSRTYLNMSPYLKGIHQTLDS